MHIVALHAFRDNYIWMIHAAQGALVVDPGDASPVLQACEAMGVELSGILVTHHHADHVGGIEHLLAHREVPVWGPADEPIPGRSVDLRGGERIEAGGLGFDVLAVPGHTRAHIAYHCPDRTWLFCGDTLFSAGCGRVFEGTPAQLLASLDKLAALPKHTLVYCAHEYTLGNLQFARHVEPGNDDTQQYERWCRERGSDGQPTLPSTIGRELKVNPFLRIDAPSLRERIAHHAGRPVRDRGDAFALLRQWKDGF